MRQIIVDILGDATKFTRATKDATTSAGKFQNVMQGIGQGLGISTFNLMGDAVSRATDYLTDAVAMAREEEVSINRLAASLEANVTGWDGNTAAIDKNIAAMVRTTAFSDDQLRDSLAKLVGSTHNVEDAFTLQATAMDLARFKGIDLVSASEALIKVEGGQYRALKELGIVLEEGATATDALAAVQKVAGGQMAAYMDTAAAKTEILSNRLADLQEELGGKLTGPLGDATEGVLDFMDAMDSDVPMEFTDRVLTIADSLNMLNPATWGSRIAMGEWQKGVERADAAAQEAKQAINGTANSANRLTGAALDAALAVARLNQRLEQTPNVHYSIPRAGSGPQARASGGPASGLTWVGEKGPELLDLPSGSHVYSNPQSMAMTRGGTGGGPTINVSVAGNIVGLSGVDELMDIMAARLRLDGV